jgi:endonuclease/exonuclease/phosphatase (EEP) superfamily protein YafD
MIALLFQGALTLGTVIGALTGWTREPRHPLVIAAAAAGPVALPYGAVVASLLVLTGSPVLAAANLLLAGAWRIGVAPRKPLIADMQDRETGMRVVGANLLCYNRRPQDAAQAIAGENAEVIITIETAPEMLDQLQRTMREHRLEGIGTGDRGEMVALWVRRDIKSRPFQLRLNEATTLPGTVLEIDGQDLHIVGVHLFAPVSRSTAEVWQQELEALRVWVVSQPRDFILIGDYNAALNHPGMRQLLDVSTDAASSTGRPMLRTWPARGFRHGRGRCVPVFGLDHALLGGRIVATGLSTKLYPGADHLALHLGITTLSDGPAGAHASIHTNHVDDLLRADQGHEGDR